MGDRALSSRTKNDVLTLWRGCYEDAHLIDTPWGGRHALALVHTLHFTDQHPKEQAGYETAHDRGDRQRSAKNVDNGDDNDNTDDVNGTRKGAYGRDADDADRPIQRATINGLSVCSPLAAPMGTYTAERTVDNGVHKWVHLYRASVPDLPGAHGRRSSAQVYVKALEAAGLDVAASTTLFTGLAWSIGRGAQAPVRVVTHQNVGLDPLEFARRTLVALGAAERAVRHRAAKVVAAADAVTVAVRHEIDCLYDRLIAAYEGAPPGRGDALDSIGRKHQDVVDTRRTHRPQKQADHQRRQRRRQHRKTDTRSASAERAWCPVHERWERIGTTCTSETGDSQDGALATGSETARDASCTTSMPTSPAMSASTTRGSTATSQATDRSTTFDMHRSSADRDNDDDDNEEAYSCCSACCSSSGCSCSMEMSTQETPS
jgi:hypothetical protein